MSSIATVNNAKLLYANMKYPLILYGIIFSVYIGYSKNWIWFSWHPIFMLISYISIVANATLIKKIGGYENTKIHGYLMSTTIVLASFAWYVIYSNKEAFHKPHLTTIHGKLGAIVMISYFTLGLFGAVFLHPDFGLMRTNKLLRTTHKWFGRIGTV